MMKNRKWLLPTLSIAFTCIFLLSACQTAGQDLETNETDTVPMQSDPIQSDPTASLLLEGEEPSIEPSPSAGIAASGACGQNATWTLDAEGTLTISGNGAVYGYMEYRTGSTAACPMLANIELPSEVIELHDGECPVCFH